MAGISKVEYIAGTFPVTQQISGVANVVKGIVLVIANLAKLVFNAIKKSVSTQFTISHSEAQRGILQATRNIKKACARNIFYGFVTTAPVLGTIINAKLWQHASNAGKKPLVQPQYVEKSLSSPEEL
jgi:hypothetical protein